MEQSSEFFADVDERCDGLTLENTVNLSREYLLERYTPRDIEVILMTYIFPVIMFLGVTGNTCFLLMMVRFPHMRSTVNYYLTSLASADLMTFVGMADNYIRSGTSPSIATIPYGYNRIGCILLEIIQATLFTVSMLNITLVTIEMYFALCKPLQHLRATNKRRTLLSIGLTWLVGVVIGVAWSLPPWARALYSCYIWPDEEPFADYPTIFGYCTFTNTFSLFVRACGWNVLFFIALIINVTLYVLIARKMKTNQMVDAQQLKHTSRNRANLNAVSKMLIINGVTFFTCLMPWSCFILGTEAYYLNHTSMNHEDIYATTYWIAYTLLCTNSMINPFIYGTFNARYRAALRSVFKRKPLLKESSSVQTGLTCG